MSDDASVIVGFVSLSLSSSVRLPFVSLLHAFVIRITQFNTEKTNKKATYWDSRRSVWKEPAGCHILPEPTRRPTL